MADRRSSSLLLETLLYGLQPYRRGQRYKRGEGSARERVSDLVAVAC